SSRPSLSSSAFAHPYLNWSKLSVIARFGVRGSRSSGPTPLSTENGSGSTPRKTPGSIATVTADRPRPASLSARRPPVEWPRIAGFLFRPWMTCVVCAATSSRLFLASASGSARATSTDAGSSGQSGVNATYPASSNTAAQRSQLEGSSQSPWMNTTGVAPLAFARSICSASRLVIGVGAALESSGAFVCAGIVVMVTLLLLVPCPRSRRGHRGGGLGRPAVEPDLSQARAVGGHERALGDGDAEVARARIRDHRSRITRRLEHPPNHLVERRPLGSGDLDQAVHGRAGRDPRDRRRDIVRSHRLELDRRQPNRAASGRILRAPPHRLHELGR